MRKQNYKTKLITFNNQNLGFEEGINFKTNPEINLLPSRVSDGFDLINKMIQLWNNTSQSDILQFHYGSIIINKNLIPNGLDLIIFKLRGNPIYIYYVGHDVRYKILSWYIHKLADGIAVSTPDLLKYVPSDAMWIRPGVDLKDHTPNYYDPGNTKALKIVHAPTRRKLKGTDCVINAVKKLISQGHNIEFQLIENESHSTAMNIMSDADIVIDWINEDYGIYGMVGIEAMAFGKPVLSSTNSFPKNFQKILPVINTNRKNIGTNLQNLITNPSRIMKLGRESRKFVEHYHNVDEMANQFIEMYD